MYYWGRNFFRSTIQPTLPIVDLFFVFFKIRKAKNIINDTLFKKNSGKNKNIDKN
jgi:hypothetical protein